MKEKINNRKILSNLITVGFICATAGTLYLSEDLKIPLRTSSEIIQEIQILHNKILQDHNSLSLINSRGEFKFTRNTETNQWQFIDSEKELKESFFINEFLNRLSEVKIRNVIESTKNNLEAYSFNSPLGQLKFINNETKHNYTINFGMYNSIDNSMYLTINGKKGIYHVESSNASIETVTLADIIETKPFPFTLSEAKSIKIYSSNTNTPLVEFNKSIESSENGMIEIWNDSKNLYSSSSITDYFSSIFSLKSSKVLESKNKQQLVLLNNIIKQPEYKISIVNEKGDIEIYLVSNVIRTFRDMSLNDEPYFVIMTNLNYPIHFIKSSDLNIFNIDQLK